MRHETLDAFARESRFLSIDPRMKLCTVITAIIVLSLLSDLMSIVGMLVLSLILLSVSKVPAGHLLKHYSITLPFIGSASVSLVFTSGIDPAAHLFLRSSGSVLFLLFVGSTTPFFELLKGLRQLRLPQVYVILLFFVYRYIFIIWDELDRMHRARMARGFVKRGSIIDPRFLRGIVGIVGMVLVRAFERGKRSYRSLLSRGFQGEIRTLGSLSNGKADILFGTLMCGFSAMTAAYETGVVG